MRSLWLMLLFVKRYFIDAVGGTSVRACLSSRGIIVGFCPAGDVVVGWMRPSNVILGNKD